MKRRQLSQGLMLESEQKLATSRAAVINGASRGEKMTKEELRMNKELLKEVASIKKQGLFENVSERCTSRKVTTID